MYLNEKQIEHIQHCARLMVNERNEIAKSNPRAEASPIWKEIQNIYAYMLDMAPSEFKYLRYRTQLYSAALYQYWHPYPEIDVNNFIRRGLYDQFTDGLPERLHASEPINDGLPRPIGVEYKGKVVNHSICRYQRAISNLYFCGVLPSIEKITDHQFIVEIGGGHGGFMYSLSSGLNVKATYILVDLPEFLLHQAVFLSQHCNDRSFYIYDPSVANEDFFISEAANYDYVFIPNYRLEWLNQLSEISLIINLISFQEMNQIHIEEYLDFAKEKLRFCLYSDNLDRHPYNPDSFNLTQMFQERFDVFPPSSYYQSVFRDQDPFNYACGKHYVCFPKGSVGSLPIGDITSGQFFAGPSKVSLQRK